MVNSSSSLKNEVFDDSFCSTSCKKNTKSLNTKITKLSEKLSDSKTMLYHYKLGLSQVEARLVEFKNQEIKFCKKIRGIEFKVESKDNKIKRLTNELEQIKKEKEVLIPPPAQVYSPPKKDMSWTGLPKFTDDTITDYSRPSPSIESNSSDLQNSDSSVFEKGDSSESIMSKLMIKFVKAADSSTEVKTNKVEAARKPSVKYAEMYRNTSKSPKFDHLAYDCGVWVNKGKSWPKNNFAQKNVTPRADLFKTASVSAARRVNSVAPRPNVNSARPNTTQDLVIILIERVKRLERELKARTLPTKIHKVDVRGRSRSVMAWVPKKELMDLCTGLQRQQTEMASKINAQDMDISSLKARIKLLEDKDRGNAEPSGDDAPIKGRSMEIGEEAGVERSTELGSNNTEEMVNVLTSMEAANILTSGVAAISVPPVAGISIVGVPTCSGLVPTVNAEIARIHAEEKLKMLIDGLDRSNEVIARHLQEYEQSEAELTIGEKIELINELVKYQDHHDKILKYQAQQSKPLSKKEQREFYMSILKSHAGWKTKHFIGMTLEEIREKFIPVWKQIEDFVPMSSTEEAQRVKRKGLKLDEGSAKRIKTFKDEEDLKGMMQLVHVEDVYVEDLQVKHPIIDWEINSEGKKDYWKIIRLGGHTTALSDKEKELWVELKRMFEPDSKDQLWTHTQNLMHDPLDWKLYDTCGVHHVYTKDQEIFMLVERDYPLRRGLAIVMISNKLQVENYSQMDNDLIMKIHNIAKSPR
nr:hypothetical protein [Tanacetum cinerariifolium]